MKPRFIGGALGSLLLFGCVGDLTGPSGPTSSGDPSTIGGAQGTTPVEFECDAALTTPAVPLQRLTRAHYERSVHDLFAATLPGAQFDAVWAQFSPSLQSLPNDAVSKHSPFAAMDSTVSQEHVGTYFRVADAAASAITGDAARIQDLLACADGASESACIDDFIARFGRLAFRHTINAEEAKFLREVYAADGIDAAALHDLIVVVLNAPQFLYHVEYGDKAVADRANTYNLSDAELASRLAYHFWQAPPDAELLAAADRHELTTEDGFKATVDRMAKDPRAKAGLQRFLAEWFGTASLQRLDVVVGNKVFDAFAGDDVPSPELNTDMTGELLDSFTWHANRGDSFAEWFLSPYSFAREAGLAELYGTPTWDGQSEPPKFPEGERAGLITRAALLATPGANSRPIMRGVFIRERLLCDSLPPPPANANAKAPDLSPTATTREVVEELTEQDGTGCTSCHSTRINGLGFALEGFDAMGRQRDEQRLFSKDGALMAEKPVDTESKPYISPDDAEPVSGAAELAERLVESDRLEPCFAVQYVRFAMGREADFELDGCALEGVRSQLAEGGSVTDALKSLAFAPAFRQRTIGDAP